MPGTRYSLEVRPQLPSVIGELATLANDLVYSWDRQARSLFFRLDRGLWESCGHSPKVFLRRVAQDKLDRAAADPIYLQDYQRVLSAFNTYRSSRPSLPEFESGRDLVAYFCLEFGLHESFPIYSGGLGILAGDHCKAASDFGLPFVGVGLLYRHGYFNQAIDGAGRQIASYHNIDFDDLPIEPARDGDGHDIVVEVAMPRRTVSAKVWQAPCGHISLYFLDCDIPANADADRRITYQLYGGNRETRIQQEMLLGLGGVRALRRLGHAPTVWHVNEGHAAFQILERCREFVAADLQFNHALEAVASTTVFTTHTPVPAGHDIFDKKQMDMYFSALAEELGLSTDALMELGANPTSQGFNMTALGLRGSRYHNGVSRIHGGVVSEMEAPMWPEIPADENPIRYVTNGVHVPTFLSSDWSNLFDMQFGSGWRTELRNVGYWARVDSIPNHSFWSVRRSLKAKLLEDVRQRALRQGRRNALSESQLTRITQHLQPVGPDVLTVGFARRFATYKRALLIFSDPGRLARLVGDPDRPVVLIFAGKAHPHDEPGQELIRQVHEFSRRPEFVGKVILLEGYDMALSRRLVTGVDVWLNNPQYPLEASGTSGEKAAMNGVLNLSVLDGWWAEGYNGTNGWAITPHDPKTDAEFRNREEAGELLDLLEHQVIPLYYERAEHGYSERWVQKAKESMKSIIPQYNAQRMVMDYITQFYAPAARRAHELSADNYQPVRELAQWKDDVRKAWPGVTVSRTDAAPRAIGHRQSLTIEVLVALNGLAPNDIVVECLIGDDDGHGGFSARDSHRFELAEGGDKQALYRLELTPATAGLRYYKLRAYPHHPLLTHRFEMGFMHWL